MLAGPEASIEWPDLFQMTCGSVLWRRFLQARAAVRLHALGECGVVRHEAPLPSGRRPDLFFDNGDLRFTADITVVSDDGLDKPLRSSILSVHSPLPSSMNFEMWMEWALMLLSACVFSETGVLLIVMS